jgi:isoquinoline 1-oxidoreductase subunit beta
MRTGGELDRRAFVVGASAAGGGLALSFGIPGGALRADPAAASAAAMTCEINCWVVIGADDTVTIRVAHAEMGQGVLTSLALLVAEELECDWAKVRTETVSASENLQRARAWGDLSTGASRSIATSQKYLRRAGATARSMLVAAAAARWNVPVNECAACNSVITHEATGRRLGFAAVAMDAAKLPPPADVALKHPSAWTLAGVPRRRLDVKQKVTGQPIYAIDVRLPNMLYAAILHCPVFHGSPKAIDESSIAGMKGVHRIVRLADAVAVVADSWWRAKSAADVLGVDWDYGGNGRSSTAGIGAFVRDGLDAAKVQVGRSNGDTAAGFAGAVRCFEAEYSVPFLAHATMEPQTCTAHVRPDGVEVWAPTQDATTTLVTAAGAAGVGNDKVKVNAMLLGGGFGRRGAIQEYVRQAVLIAMDVGQPVKLIWTREQDIAHDQYRPCSMARLTAGLDADGMPTTLTIRLAGPSFVASLIPQMGSNIADRSFVSGLADEMAYDVANYRIDYAICPTNVPLGVWRGINYTQNAFYKESFIDELAHLAEIDPYEYRRRLLRNSPKNLAVLDAAAHKADWGGPLPDGVFRGIAVNEACGSFCAQVVEASVIDGRVRVHRVVSALDCGHAVNPLSIQMQTEGAVIFALTAALYGEITIKDGAVEQSNFHDYEMLHLADAPQVETVLVPSGGFWGGVGEPPVPPLAPALCNAIFAATGKRIRSLPLKNHDLRATVATASDGGDNNR